MLTFNQFKSMVVKSGLISREERLQKSYASLLQLRRQNHYSWAQIKLKMRTAQEVASTAQVERLPITARDWRRII
jgi:hypothetical protein